MRSLRTIDEHTIRPAAPPDKAALEELQAIRHELAALRRLIDAFAAVYLNARFPHGRPLDQWRRP